MSKRRSGSPCDVLPTLQRLVSLNLCERTSCSLATTTSAPLSHTHTRHTDSTRSKTTSQRHFTALTTLDGAFYENSSMHRPPFSPSLQPGGPQRPKLRKAALRMTLTTPCLHLRAGPKHKLRDRRTGGGTPLGHIYTASVLCSFKMTYEDSLKDMICGEQDCNRQLYPLESSPLQQQGLSAGKCEIRLGAWLM